MKLSERFDLSRLPWQRAARLGPALAWGVALAVTAWVTADLFWRFSAPRPPALPVASLADPQAAAQAIASRHLMGQGATAGPGAAPAAPSRYALQAVVTGSGGRPGWAIMSIDGGPQEGVVEGQEIRPGLTLALVRGDAVELSTGGARQTIRLTDRAGAAPGTATGLPPAMPNPGGEVTDSPADPAQRPFPAGFPVNAVVQPIPTQSNP